MRLPYGNSQLAVNAMNKRQCCHSFDQGKELRSFHEDMYRDIRRHGMPEKETGATGQEEGKQAKNLASRGILAERWMGGSGYSGWKTIPSRPQKLLGTRARQHSEDLVREERWYVCMVMGR